MIILFLFIFSIFSSILAVNQFCSTHGVVQTSFVIDNDKESMKDFEIFSNTLANTCLTEKMRLNVRSNHIPGVGLCTSLPCIHNLDKEWRNLIHVDKLFRYNPEATPGSLLRAALIFLERYDWHTNYSFSVKRLLVFTQRDPKTLLEEFKAYKVTNPRLDNFPAYDLISEILEAVKSTDPEFQDFESLFQHFEVTHKKWNIVVDFITLKPSFETYEKLFNSFSYQGKVVDMNDSESVKNYMDYIVDMFNTNCKIYSRKLKTSRMLKSGMFPIKETGSYGLNELFKEKTTDSASITDGSPTVPVEKPVETAITASSIETPVEAKVTATSIETPVEATVTATSVETPVEATVTATSVEVPFVEKKAYQEGLLDNTLPTHLRTAEDVIDSDKEIISKTAEISTLPAKDSSTSDTIKKVANTFFKDLGKEVQTPLIGPPPVEETRTLSRATASGVVRLADDVFDVLSNKFRHRFIESPSNVSNTTTTTMEPKSDTVATTDLAIPSLDQENTPFYKRKWFIILCIACFAALLLGAAACYMRFRSSSGNVFPVTSLTVIDTNRDTDLEREQLTHSIHEAYA